MVRSKYILYKLMVRDISWLLYILTYILYLLSVRSRESSVGIGMGYGLDGWARFPAGVTFFSSPQYQELELFRCRPGRIKDGLSPLSSPLGRPLWLPSLFGQLLWPLISATITCCPTCSSRMVAIRFSMSPVVSCHFGCNPVPLLTGVTCYWIGNWIY
jgi:hypothetical protein